MKPHIVFDSANLKGFKVTNTQYDGRLQLHAVTNTIKSLASSEQNVTLASES